MNYDTQPIADVMDEAIFRLNKVIKKTPQKTKIRRYLEINLFNPFINLIFDVFKRN